MELKFEEQDLIIQKLQQELEECSAQLQTRAANDDYFK